MGTAGMPPPEAVLTELVIMTLLAAVAEAHHTLSVAVGALDRVKHCRGGGGGVERRGQTNTHKHKHVCTNCRAEGGKKKNSHKKQTNKAHVRHGATIAALGTFKEKKNCGLVSA